MKTVYEANGNAVNILQDSDIASGNNYIYFPDGTLICRGTFGINGNGEITGSLHVNFPAEFINTPSIAITNIYAYKLNIIWSISTVDNYSFIPYFHSTDGSPPTSGQIVSADYIAIGRWK